MPSSEHRENFRPFKNEGKNKESSFSQSAFFSYELSLCLTNRSKDDFLSDSSLEVPIYYNLIT